MKKQEAALKVIRAVDDLIDWCVRAIMILVLLTGIYMTADSLGVYYNAAPGRVSVYRPAVISTETLGEIGEDAVAWLSIDDTTIDYPIMQGASNSEYLNKDASGNYSLTGSIFLDSRNAGDFSDPYSLVYGHHMSGGYMFGALDSFADSRYFSRHRTGTLSVGEREFDFLVAAYLECRALDMEIFDPENEDHVAFIKNHADIIDETADLAGSRIVALTTCQAAGSKERTVLIGIIADRENGPAET